MDYNQIELITTLEKKNFEKHKTFIERVSEFKNVLTLQEAKMLANKILPTSQE